MTGSNASVSAVDFDAEESLILGASNDFASRVWTVLDHRLRVSKGPEFINYMCNKEICKSK